MCLENRRMILCPLTHSDIECHPFPTHLTHSRNQIILIPHSQSLHSCPDCQFPLCSSGCISHDHTAFECQFFKSHNLVKHLHWDAHRQELESDYEAITVLRWASQYAFLSSLSWWRWCGCHEGNRFIHHINFHRCLLLKLSSPEQWQKLTQMEAHSEISESSRVLSHFFFCFWPFLPAESA